ncbi:MAG: DNA polymerase IV, partial [Anaerolineaceae bacterium]|nr:DNA polymerase IV [Anaerolineaceae bacterium]
ATPPSAITEVLPGKEAEFLAPLPVDALWGVGPKTKELLGEWGIQTIGELASQNENDFSRRFGNYGRELIQRARGVDTSLVSPTREMKSVSQEITFAKDVGDKQILTSTLRDLSQTVGRRLRADDLAGKTVKIKIRWPDFTTFTRQVSLDQPVDQDLLIFESAFKLFEREWSPGKKVRLIGVGVSGLSGSTRQLPLWDTRGEKEKRLMEAMDEIHEKFGRKAVHRGIVEKTRD